MSLERAFQLNTAYVYLRKLSQKQTAVDGPRAEDGGKEEGRKGEWDSLLEQFYKDRLQVKTEQVIEWKGVKRLKQIARVNLKPSIAIQSEAKRSQFESVSLERSLSQNSWVEPASQSSERTRKGELIQQQVSEAENTLGLIVWRLEAFRFRPRDSWTSQRNVLGSSQAIYSHSLSIALISSLYQRK